MSSVKRMRPYLGTFVEIGIQPAASINIDAVFQEAFQAIKLIHDLLSFHDSQSDLSRLNASSGKSVALNPTSIKVLKLAKAVTKASNHRFNFTAGGALLRKGILPLHHDIPSLDYGDAEDVQIAGSNVTLKRPVSITLDGIAKGYAIDCAVQKLVKLGVESGWVNAGGDMRAFGECLLPVQRRELDGSYTLLGGIKNAALASSSVLPEPSSDFPGWITNNQYHRYEGVWTVMADSAWRADALTKVAAFSAPEERAKLISRLGGVFVESAMQ